MRPLALALAFFFASPVALAATSTCNWSKTGTQLCTVSYADGNGNETETMRVHVPANLPKNPALVVYLHGAPGGEYECDNTTWAEKCDAVGCVLACPRGGMAVAGGYSWNSLYPSTTPDDVAWIHELVDLIHTQLGTDASRVYATGFSAGGWMSHRVGYELGGEVAAIGVISSSLYIRDIGKSTVLPNAVAPVSVIELAGNDDASIFYCGETNANVTVASQDETFAYWTGAQGDACASVSATTPLCTSSHGTTLPGGALTSLDEKHATQCNGDAEVQIYELAGGVHKYYSGDLTTPPGDATNPYDAHLNAATGTTGIDVLWNFFASHPSSGSPPPIVDAGTDAEIADAAVDANATIDAGEVTTPTNEPGGCSLAQRPRSREGWPVLAFLVLLRRRPKPLRASSR